jgi:HSP20 family protein
MRIVSGCKGNESLWLEPVGGSVRHLRAGVAHLSGSVTQKNRLYEQNARSAHCSTQFLASAPCAHERVEKEEVMAHATNDRVSTGQPAKSWQSEGSSQTQSAQPSQSTQSKGQPSSTALQQQGRQSPESVQRYGSSASNPFGMMRRFMDDMDRVFEGFGLGGSLFGPSPFGRSLGPSGGWSGAPQSLWNPQIEVFQRGEQMVVRADLPGLTKDDIQVQIQDDALLIAGERRHESKGEEQGFFHTERSYGRFERAIALPEGASPENIEASFENGVLEISLPLPAKQARGRTIEVKSSRAQGAGTESSSGPAQTGQPATGVGQGTGTPGKVSH